jgi:RND family efflux transporter MFP subunit
MFYDEKQLKEDIMKRFYKLAIAIVCAAMLSACGSKGQQGGPMGAMPGMTQSNTTSVEVEMPKVETVKDEYRYTGTMAANDEVDVTAKVSGKVTTVNYEVGDYVQKGAVLFTIDTTDIENQLNTSKASLKTTDANIASAKTNYELANGSSVQSSLANAKNQVTNAEKTIESRKNALETAKTNLENAQSSLAAEKVSYDKAQSDYDTNKQLYDVGGLSKDALDNSANSLEQSKNSYTQKENAVKSAQTAVSDAQIALEQAETALEQAQESYEIAQQTPAENSRKAQDSLNSAVASRATIEAQIKSTESSLKDYTVTSPISGYVTAKNVTEGAMFNGTAYTICDTSTVNIEVNVSEDIETRVHVGDDVRILVPSISDDELVGNITEINPAANQDGTYTIKVNMDNAEGKYKSGLYAEVYFAKSTSENALTVTRNSVLHSNDEYCVYVENNGTVTKKIVTVGIDTGERIEVTSGITAEDRVVSKGQTYLKDGDEVNVVAVDGVDMTSSNTSTADEQPSGENGEMPNGEKPDGDMPQGEKPSDDKSKDEKSDDKSQGEKPSGDEKSDKDKPKADKEA